MAKNAFHESYFEHRCAVIDKKDVLLSDIPGLSFMSRLKRWWYGLFLLSYSDVRSKSFHTSSESIRLERMIHYRKFRSRIHPFSRFRHFWDNFMFILFTLNLCMLHHNTSALYSEVFTVVYYLGATNEIIILIDLFINTRTGYIDNESRKVVLNYDDGIMHYCSTKMFLHVASAIPLQWLLFLRYGSNVSCSLCKINKFIMTLKLISVFGLFRIYEYSSVLNRECNTYKLTQLLRFIRIFVLAFITMMEFIDLFDTSVLLAMIAEGKIDDDAYTSLLLRTKFATKYIEHSYQFWIMHFSRIFKGTFQFTFADNRKIYYLDKLSSLLALLIASVFSFWTFIELYGYINRIRFHEDRVFGLRNMMQDMASSRMIPYDASRKLDKFLDFTFTQKDMVKVRNNQYRSLPAILKREAALVCHINLIKRIPYFKNWPIDMIEDIVVMLKEEIYLDNDMIAEPWVASEGLLVVYIGEVAVYNGKVETGHLIEGDFFGELSLVTDKELRTSTVISIKSSVILLLEKTLFRQYMRRYPDRFFAMRDMLMNKFQKDAHPSTRSFHDGKTTNHSY